MLFHDTIRENIGLSDPDISTEAIMAAPSRRAPRNLSLLCRRALKPMSVKWAADFLAVNVSA